MVQQAAERPCESDKEEKGLIATLCCFKALELCVKMQ